MAVREDVLRECVLVRVNDPAEAASDGVLLVCREQAELMTVEGLRSVNVVEELAKDELVIGQFTLEGAGA